MSYYTHSSAAINGSNETYDCNDLPPRRPAEPTVVEVRNSGSRRGWLSSMCWKLPCWSSRNSVSESIHFHARRIQDVSKSRISVSFFFSSDDSLEDAVQQRLTRCFTTMSLLRSGICPCFSHSLRQSVHVMIKHDKDACMRRGLPVKGYTPREPLPVRLAAARIQASEDD